MIDLHTHTFLSDGSLSVSELVYREKCAGYTAVAITDHADESNIESLIVHLKKAVTTLTNGYAINVLIGVELTYVPPAYIGHVAQMARTCGAQIIVVHGETSAEHVPPGTNRAAIEAGVDILAHPGMIREEDVCCARDRGVCLEITSRRGHRDTNAWVASCAKKQGALMVFDNDVHHPDNILTRSQIDEILHMAALTAEDFDLMVANAARIIEKKGVRL